MAEALLSDADLGISSPSLYVPPQAPPSSSASPGDAPPPSAGRPLTIRPPSSGKPQLFTDADLGIASPSGAGVLANSPDDTNTSGFLKGAGTAVIRGLSDIPGVFGSSMDVADYILARAQAKITGRPLQDILQDQAADKAASANSPVYRYLDPRNWLPSGQDIAAPVLARTGQYEPTSEAGKLGMAAGEAAIAGFTPGMGGARMLLPNAAAGAAAQGTTDFTGDPLYGMAAGAAAAGAAEAGTVAARRVAGPAIAGLPGIDNLPIIGPATQAARERAVGGQILAQSSDPAALRTWAQQPDQPPIVPGSPNTTAAAVGNDRGLFQAEKDARNANNLPFNAIDAAKSQAQQSAIGAQQPTGDVFRPGQMFASRLDALETAAQTAEDRLTAAHNDAVAQRNQGAQQFEDQANADLLARQADRGAVSTARLDQLGADQQAAHQQLVQSFSDAHDRLQQQAVDAAALLGASVPPEQLGSTLRGAIEETRSTVKAERRALYQAVDPDGQLTILASPVREAASRIAGAVDPLGDEMQGAEARIFDKARTMPDVVPFSSLMAFDKSVTDAMSAERRAAGETDVWRRLQQLKSAVMGSIHDGVDNQAAYERRLVNEGAIRPDQALDARLKGLWGDDAAGVSHASGISARTGTYSGELAGSGAGGGARSVRAARETGGQSRQAPRDPGIPQEAPVGDFQGRVGRPAAPTTPRAQSLIDFIRAHGGVRDTHGDLKHLGYDSIRGLIAKAGQGLSPDHMREVAAEAGYLGGDTAGAVQRSTINDLFDAIDPNRPVYSVRDEQAVHAWDVYDHQRRLHEAGRGEDMGRGVGPQGRPASSYRQEDAYPPGLSPSDLRAGQPRPNFDEDARQRLAAAKAAHAAYAQTFKQGPVGEALRTTGFSGQYRTPNAGVIAKAFVSGDKGFESASAFLKASRNDPVAIEALRQYALNHLRDGGVLPIGAISPTKLAAWRSKYEGALRAIDQVSPGFSDSYSTAAKATQALLDAGMEHKLALNAFRQDQAAKLLSVQRSERAGLQAAGKADQATVSASIGASRDAVRQANRADAAGLRSAVANQRGIVDRAGKTASGRFGRIAGAAVAPDEVENVVGAMLSTGQGGAARMRSLIADAKADPEAVPGLRKAGVDYMLRRFVNADGSLSSAAFIKFIRENGATLRELFSPQQVQMFAAVVRDAEVGARWRTETAIKGGSDTVKNIGGIIERAKEAGRHFSFMSAATAAATAAYMHGGLKEGVYAGTAAGVAYLYNSLRSAGLGRARALYREALLDPRLAKALIAKMPIAPLQQTNSRLHGLVGLVRQTIIRGPMLTGSEVMQEKR